MTVTITQENEERTEQYKVYIALRACPFCGMEKAQLSIDGTVECGNCGTKGPWDRDAYGGFLNEHEMWNARVCKRVVELEYALRDIALFVSVGGYNDDTLPEDIAQRIKDGIIALIRNNTNNQQPDHQ